LGGCLPKKWAWYMTDLGFEETKERLFSMRRSQFVGDGQNNKGRFSFELTGFKDVTYQVTKHGKLGVYYPDSINLKDCLERVGFLLVRGDGEPARILGIIRESEALDKVAIVNVSINRSSVGMPGCFTIELTVKNDMKTSTYLRRISFETDGKNFGQDVDVRIPAGETLQVPPIQSSETLFGRTWKEGGKIDLKVIHTYGETPKSLEAPPLWDKILPFTLFSE
jgi:hypothetical protein